MRFLVLAAFVLVPGAPARAEPPPGASSCSGCHALSPRSSRPCPGSTVAAPRSIASQCRTSKRAATEHRHGPDRQGLYGRGDPGDRRVVRGSQSDSEAEMARPGLNRRQVLTSLGAAAVAPLGAPARAQAAPRVVVIGGGFAGASAARAIKGADPRIGVTLVESNRTFTACPFSKPGDRRPAGVAGAAVRLRQGRCRAASTSSSPRLPASTPPARRVALEGGTSLPYDRLDRRPRHRHPLGRAARLHRGRRRQDAACLEGRRADAAAAAAARGAWRTVASSSCRCRPIRSAARRVPTSAPA